jgi:hypothetical protein
LTNGPKRARNGNGIVSALPLSYTAMTKFPVQRLGERQRFELCLAR